MATNIKQHPLFPFFPVGQDVIFTLSNNPIVTNVLYTRVKFVAEVHISDSTEVNLSNNNDVVGTFKTTPNNAARGMFNFRPIIENFVKTDNMALATSSYKTDVNTDLRTPLHLIDKYSGNNNSFRYFGVQFSVEYFDNDVDSNDYDTLVRRDFKNSDIYNIFNGYLKYNDQLTLGAISGVNFGYDTNIFNLTDATTSFLTNAPVTQYANIEDYGTTAILMINPLTDINLSPLAPLGGTGSIRFDYYQANGSPISGTSFETIRLDDLNNGGFNYADRDFAYNMLVYAGVFPANLRNHSTLFNANIDDIAYYTYVAQTFTAAAAANISKTYTININCPTLKGYEPIRLTWLNQWGAWDYYTFTMKSSKSTSTKGSTYRQLEGTWNESVYRTDGFKGGKKSFRVNATENITMNTDFVSESDSEWFEELINSPEVYILDGFKTDITNSALNNYITPVRLTTSRYTKKTVANDKIMQYTFEVEKTKTLRTQSV